MSVAKRIIGKTLLAKIYANDKTATKCYQASLPLPHGPSSTSEWRRASRPEIPEYVRGLLHYEVAIMSDKHRILDFLKVHVFPSSPLFASLAASPDELLDLYTPIVEKALKYHSSLLGFMGDQLIAVSLNCIKTISSEAQVVSGDVQEVARKDYSSGML
jgi:hypothetical protein